MEPVGLGIGIASLLGQVLECFEYIYLARTFGSDYQTYQLKFDGARLRLSRWGAAMNWDDVKDERNHAEKLLQQIYALFIRTQALSAEFERTHRLDGMLPPTEVDKATGLDRVTEILHEKMRSLSIKRSPPSKSPMKKAKWAVYSREHMRDLTEDITDLTNQLVELFPATQEQQKFLCSTETYEFLDSLRVLNKAVEQQDKILSTALVKILEPVEQTIEFLTYNSKVGVQVRENSGAINQTF